MIVDVLLWFGAVFTCLACLLSMKVGSVDSSVGWGAVCVVLVVCLFARLFGGSRS